MQSSSVPLKIGRLARAANVGIETIRYYQRRRLLQQPARLLRGQRLYSPDYVDQLRFIKRAQTLGFSLDEIAALLSWTAVPVTCVLGRSLARALPISKQGSPISPLCIEC